MYTLYIHYIYSIHYTYRYSTYVYTIHTLYIQYTLYIQVQYTYRYSTVYTIHTGTVHMYTLYIHYIYSIYYTYTIYTVYTIHTLYNYTVYIIHVHVNSCIVSTIMTFFLSSVYYFGHSWKHSTHNIFLSFYIIYSCFHDYRSHSYHTSLVPTHPPPLVLMEVCLTSPLSSKIPLCYWESNSPSNQSTRKRQSMLLWK